MRRKIITGAFLGFAMALVTSTAASAHVTVNPKTAEPGSYAKLTFRVPNERPDAGTTKVEINIPTDKAIASVSVQPQPGWSYVVEKTKLATPIDNHGTQQTEAISKITWTADGGTQIKPGEFGEFNISAGPLPKDTATVTFKALQTYSNGEVVRWIEEASDGQEVEKPAPVLTLAKSTATANADFATKQDTKDLTAAVNDSNFLAWIGIGIGTLAAVLALVGFIVRKKA